MEAEPNLPEIFFNILNSSRRLFYLVFLKAVNFDKFLNYTCMNLLQDRRNTWGIFPAYHKSYRGIHNFSLLKIFRILNTRKIKLILNTRNPHSLKKIWIEKGHQRWRSDHKRRFWMENPIHWSKWITLIPNPNKLFSSKITTFSKPSLFFVFLLSPF